MKKQQQQQKNGSVCSKSTLLLLLLSIYLNRIGSGWRKDEWNTDDKIKSSHTRIPQLFLCKFVDAGEFIYYSVSGFRLLLLLLLLLWGDTRNQNVICVSRGMDKGREGAQSERQRKRKSGIENWMTTITFCNGPPLDRINY